MTVCELLDEPQVDDESAPLANFVYHEIRAELARRGIPPTQVAFIQDYGTKARRAALYTAMNRGDIRVLIASKQSTGMNVQQCLVALHHLDCPWRPGDLEQREGRILRQGNHFPEALVLAYVTEGSFDAFSWQTIETKASFIEQMKRGDVTIRAIDDIDDAVLSAAEIKAIASGNPLIMEKVKLEMHLQQLEAGTAADRTNRVRMRHTRIANDRERQRLQARRPMLCAAQAQVQQSAQRPFSVTLMTSLLDDTSVTYRKRETAGEALLTLLDQLAAHAYQTQSRQTCTPGQYRGFLLSATAFAQGSPELSVRYVYDRTAHPLSANAVSTRTALGIFASIDSMLKGLDREIAHVDRMVAELDAETSTIERMLATPWEQDVALRAARERMEQLNTALDRSEHQATDLPSATCAREEETRQSDPGTDEVEAELDISYEHPLVLLPEPANAAAMTAALRLLSGIDADQEAVDTSMVTLETAVSEAQDAAALLPLTEQRSILPNTVLPGSTPSPTRLIFGLSPHGAARKPKKANIAPGVYHQVSLFAICESISSCSPPDRDRRPARLDRAGA